MLLPIEIGGLHDSMSYVQKKRVEHLERAEKEVMLERRGHESMSLLLW